MARKDIRAPLSDIALNNINNNFIELYKEYIQAGDNARDARNKAEQAVADSLLAKETAEVTREEMLAIIQEQTRNGDLAPEIAQARGGKSTLGERLNSTDQQLAQIPYYEEITYEKYRDETSETDYYITHIPHKDQDGNLIELKHGFQNDLINSGNGETARNFSERHNASLVINASTWSVDSGIIHGIQIKGGVIVKDTPHSRYYTLGIKDDNTLIAYPPSTSAQTILNDGCINALTGFYPIIENGEPSRTDIHHAGHGVEKGPRQVIAQLANKDIIIISVEGRAAFNEGMDWNDLLRVLNDRGVVFAYNLDGGGSTSTVVRGVQINNPIDDNGLTERKVADFLFITKPVTHPQKFKTISSDLGNIGKKLSDLEAQMKNIRDFYMSIQLVGPKGEQLNGIESWEGNEQQTKLYLRKDNLSYYDYEKGDTIFRANADGDIYSRKGTLGTFLNYSKSVNNLDTLKESGFYHVNSSAEGVPTRDTAWIVSHNQINASSAMQIAYPYSTFSETVYMRRTTSGVFGNWRQVHLDLKGVTDFSGFIRLMGSVGFNDRGIEGWEGNEQQTKLYLRKDELRYYSYLTDESMFAVFNNGDIFSKKGILGTFLKFTKNITNLNSIEESGMYFVRSDASGVPSSNCDWVVIHFQMNESSKMQVAFPYSDIEGSLNIRRTLAGSFGNWRSLLDN